MGLRPREDEAAVLNATMGNTYKIIVDDTTTIEGDFFCVQALTDCVIDEMLDSSIESGSMDGKTLAYPSYYFGNITSLTLTSGQAILYSFSKIVRV
jgi:hypothetical protein